MTDADRKKTLASPEVAAERARAGESHALPEVRAAFVMAPGPIQMLDPASLVAIRTPVTIMLGDEDKDAPPATNGLIAAKAIPGATLLRLPGVGHTDFLPDCTDAGRATFPQWCTFSVPQADTHRQAIAAAQEFLPGRWRKRPSRELIAESSQNQMILGRFVMLQKWASYLILRSNETSPHFRLWPDPDLPWSRRLRRLLGNKRTRCARREIFRI